VLLRALAHRRVKQAGIDISMKALLAELDAIKEVIVASIPESVAPKPTLSIRCYRKLQSLQQSFALDLDVKTEKWFR